MDPLQIDLVAGEEEEHPKPEVRKELDELIDLSETKDLGPDSDPQQQLDDHNGRCQPSG
jgi:hypothetical protein